MKTITKTEENHLKSSQITSNQLKISSKSAQNPSVCHGFKPTFSMTCSWTACCAESRSVGSSPFSVSLRSRSFSTSCF